MLSSGDFNNLIQARAEQTESTFSGQTANGETVTTNVVFDYNATIIWEYNTMIDIKGTATGMKPMDKCRLAKQLKSETHKRIRHKSMYILIFEKTVN